MRRMTMMRNQIDQAAWATPGVPDPFAGRPEGFECSGPSRQLPRARCRYGGIRGLRTRTERILHEFYPYKTADFFAVEPPVQFSIERRVADAHSTRFGLPVPEWARKPDYALAKPWDPSSELHPGMLIEERISYASPAFRKRNVVFKERSLIAL